MRVLHKIGRLKSNALKRIKQQQPLQLNHFARIKALLTAIPFVQHDDDDDDVDQGSCALLSTYLPHCYIVDQAIPRKTTC